MNKCADGSEWNERRSRTCPLIIILGCLLLSPFGTFAQIKLGSVEAVQALNNQQASLEIPVAFEATVVYSRGYQRLLFVEDDHAAVFILAPDQETHLPGDRIQVVGKTAPSFRPIVLANSITLLRRGPVPDPVPAGFSELIRAQFDSRLVSIHAIVRSADLITNRTPPIVRSARLRLNMAGGQLDAYVDCEDGAALESLIDSEVEIRGVAAGKFDDKMQQTGIVLYVSKLGDIRVLKRASTSPWSLKPLAMDQILSKYKVNDLSERVRVFGTITYYQPGSAVVLESGTKSLWVATQTRAPLRVGDIATVIGFPNAHDRVLSLEDSEIRDSGIQAPVPPHPATWQQLALWDSSKPIGHQFDLVSTEGEVIAEVPGALEDEYVLSEGGRLFSAIYRHPREFAAVVPMRNVPLHSKIRVSGICIVADTSVINPGEEVPFDILLRSFDDIEVIAGPSLLTVRNLLAFVGVLILLLFLVGLKAWLVERKSSRHIADIAFMERKRAQILADINGKRPLTDIVEDITQMVSFKLRGMPCWCEISDGARLGNFPHNPGAFRVNERRIEGLSGSDLGTISVAFGRLSAPQKQETETLSAAAAVAALAIETRRLHSDLVHRSEFDQLTETHNRFAFEKHLDELIDAAGQSGRMFAVIYVDLNDFKLVNDSYGHLVGDLYLCQASSRMKRQLRDSDLLGRLGGDEFGVLLPRVHSRTEIEEVVHRLEGAFLEPFDAEGYVVQGSASFGFGLYPEDGKSKDELLSAADAAMYVAKQTKKEAARRSSFHPQQIR